MRQIVKSKCGYTVCKMFDLMALVINDPENIVSTNIASTMLVKKVYSHSERILRGGKLHRGLCKTMELVGGHLHGNGCLPGTIHYTVCSSELV